MNYYSINHMKSFDRSPPMMLYRTLDAIMPAYRDLFARHGLTEPQWRVLRVIWASRNVTAKQLSERTLLSQPSLVAIIDRLEKKGLVSRMRSVKDRRAIHIIATAEGRSLQERVTPEVDAIQGTLRERMSASEWQILEGLLVRLATPQEAQSENRTA